MSNAEFDKLIKRGEAVTFHNERWNETFVGVPISRKRSNVSINLRSEKRIGLFDRDELIVVDDS